MKEYIWLNGKPLAQVMSNAIYYYHSDHLNTQRVLTDVGQAVAWAASYTPFGEAFVETEVVGNNLRFPGQYYDEESGLHQNWHRYYDPRLGRYLRSDPIGLSDGPNKYSYVHQNPLTYYDPNGESAIRGAWWVGTRIGSGINWGIRTTTGKGLGTHIYHWTNSDDYVDSFEAQSEYLRYKKFCQSPPPPTGDKCKDMRNEINHLQRCVDMREQWDNRYKPGHHKLEIDKLKKYLKKLKKRYANACSCRDQPLDCDD